MRLHRGRTVGSTASGNSVLTSKAPVKSLFESVALTSGSTQAANKYTYFKDFFTTKRFRATFKTKF